MDLKGVKMKERQLMEALISYGMETPKITRAYERQIN
jgi:hypothetical protein